MLACIHEQRKQRQFPPPLFRRIPISGQKHSAAGTQCAGQKRLVETDILTNWNAIIGEELAAYTFPQKIDFKRGEKTGGTLHLAVPSGAFALEVQHREKFILQKINTYFGYNAVSNLRIAQNAGLSLKDMLPKETSRRPKKLVTTDEENYIKDLAEEINRPELKEILIKLGQSVFTDNNLKEKK